MTFIFYIFLCNFRTTKHTFSIIIFYLNHLKVQISFRICYNYLIDLIFGWNRLVKEHLINVGQSGLSSKFHFHSATNRFFVYKKLAICMLTTLDAKVGGNFDVNLFSGSNSPWPAGSNLGMSNLAGRAQFSAKVSAVNFFFKWINLGWFYNRIA